MALTDVELNLGSGGAKIAVDRIGNRDYEVVKQAFGEEGQLILVSDTNPLPVYIVANTSLQFITATEGQTDFTFAGVPASYSDYLFGANGGLLDPPFDFTQSGNTLTVAVPRNLNDRMRFQKING